MQSAQAAIALIATQQPAAHEPLLACFQRLVSDNGVSFAATSNTKANRLAFVKNFREFVLGIRAVVVV